MFTVNHEGCEHGRSRRALRDCTAWKLSSLALRHDPEFITALRRQERALRAQTRYALANPNAKWAEFPEAIRRESAEAQQAGIGANLTWLCGRCYRVAPAIRQEGTSECCGASIGIMNY